MWACCVAGILIFPPSWMIYAAKSNIAQAPINNEYVIETKQDTEIEEKRPREPVMMSENDLKGVLMNVSLKYGVDYTELERVVGCESGWNVNAVGKAGELGLAQFKKPTWELFNKERNTNLNIYSSLDQLEMIAWAFSKGYQHHWTCYYITHY